MNTETLTKSYFELLIHLVDSIIWPLTVILILLIFRRNLSEIINRLGSVKADGTGVAISFENKITSTQKMFQQIKPETLSKSGQEINPLGIKQESPFAQISNLKTNLITYLKERAKEDNLNTDGLSATMLCDKLKETGAITIQKAKMITALLEVIDVAKPSATQKQADDVARLFSKIEID